MNLKPVKIKSISRLLNPDKDLRTWDLQTQDDHTYLIGHSLDNSIVSHNTECKLSEFSEAVLFSDINDDSVDFIDNYTNEFKEPSVLPARIPLILLTGSNGIAVGMATNIVPHNLREVCAGLIALIKNPDITLKELMEHIPAPDFPLGGKVRKNPEMINAYETGNGFCEFRVPAKVEEKTIVFHQIPYMQNKCDIIGNISKLVRDEKLEGIAEVRDETDKEEIRVCVDLKRGVDPETVIEAIYKYTDLSKKFTMNAIAIMDQKPKLVGLVDILKAFVEFRMEVIKRRTTNQKVKAEKRKEIIDGIIIAIQNAEEVLKIIKAGNDPVEQLQQKLKMTLVQAEYVFNMPMRRFSRQDTTELTDENIKISQFIKDQQSILSDKNKVSDIMIAETQEISDKFSHDRRTKLVSRF